MTISIHQPNFIPWIGYFFKILKSDTFVILDNVQFTKNGFTNRNRIKTPQGESWLTLPIEQSGKFGQNIDECLIFRKEQHVKKITASIYSNYRKSEFFDLYYDSFCTILNNSDDNLSHTNTVLIQWIMKELQINTPVILSSQLDGIEGESTERLVSICKKMNATHYLAGLGAKKYQDDELFKQASIEIIGTPFKYPLYKQLWGEFIPNLSVLDVMFNCGPETVNILRNAYQ